VTVTSDKRYGRQGGRWLPDKPPRAMPEGAAAVRPADLSPLALFHPLTIARSLAHRDKARQVSCPADGPNGHVADCRCGPPEDVLAEVWQGAARMAKARRDAGVVLSAIDLQALDRYPDPPMTGAPT